jgi:hypothetical protein
MGAFLIAIYKEKCCYFQLKSNIFGTPAGAGPAKVEQMW